MSRISRFLALAEQELETSQLLLDNGRYRACISRAYYAMYYSTQTLLQAKNVASRSHKGTIQQFSLHFVKSGEFSADLARGLSDNYDLRQLSDYEETAVLERAQADTALAASIEFVRQIREYLNRAK